MTRYVAPPPSPPKIVLGHIPKGYAGTEQTVEHIIELIRAGAKDFYVRQKAIDILLAEGVRPKDYLGEIRALFEWVRRNIRYTKDPFRVETLHSAQRMLELRAGDCDDMTILLGAMLKSIGHPVRLVLTGFDPQQPRQFSHIYLEANVRGRWIPLDATMPHPMGWSPPAAQRQTFEIEEESNMIAEMDEELRGLGETATELPWVRSFILRLWRSGAQRRDTEVRALWRTLRQQRRVGRGTWMRQFIRSIWRQGIQARDPQIRQFARQLREWGLLSWRRAGPPYLPIRPDVPWWRPRPFPPYMPSIVPPGPIAPSLPVPWLSPLDPQTRSVVNSVAQAIAPMVQSGSMLPAPLPSFAPPAPGSILQTMTSALPQVAQAMMGPSGSILPAITGALPAVASALPAMASALPQVMQSIAPMAQAVLGPSGGILPAITSALPAVASALPVVSQVASALTSPISALTSLFR